MKRVVDSDVMELDILVTCKEKTVFIVEVKSNPNRVDYIYDFKNNLNRFSKFFPEYSEYEKVLVYVAISMSQEIINKLTKEKIYAMVLRGDILDIVNTEDIERSQ